MPIDAGAWARSNHGPPSIAVTVAPLRSAIRPAAATSQADSPPCWTNASNRPLATYARARAADPIDREIRIALRMFRARVATDRPSRAIDNFEGGFPSGKIAAPGIILSPLTPKRVS